MSKSATMMTNKSRLNSVLIPLSWVWKRGKVHLRFTENPPAHTNNCRCDAWKCDIMPQIKVNPSKATCFFHSYCLSLLARRHKSPAAIGCLSSMYPSNRSSSPSLALCLWAEITGLTDGVGAELLPQLWRSFLVSNSDLCTISFALAHRHRFYFNVWAELFIFPHL